MDNLKDLYVAGIAAVAAFLYWLGNYDKKPSGEEESRGARLRRLSFGCVGAMTSCWLTFEALFYLGLPFRLCLAIASFVAYLGGDFVVSLVNKIIDKRLEKM